MIPSRAEIEMAERLNAYARDPWHWIREVVWTVDEVDRVQPIKRFPVAACVRCRRYAGGDENIEYADPDTFVGGRCRLCTGPLQELAYLRWLTRAWQAAGSRDGAYRTPGAEGPPLIEGHPPIMAIPKPRRMRLSWLMVALHTHLAMFSPNAQVFFVSSKLEKSAELIDRAEGILTRIPEERITVPPFTRTGTLKGGMPMIEFAHGAKLWGVPEGADQLRQYTATCILADEIGTWTWPRESYTAFKPCIEGGGQITLVSSAYPGFWAELVSGELTA
jgi:hypothetical protein